MSKPIYRNSTYQIIRSITSQANQTFQRVWVAESDPDLGITTYVCRQMIKTYDQDMIHRIDLIVGELNAHGLILEAYNISTRPVLDGVHLRLIRLETCLPNTDYGREFYPAGAHQFWDVPDIPMCGMNVGGEGIRLIDFPSASDPTVGAPGAPGAPSDLASADLSWLAALS